MKKIFFLLLFFLFSCSPFKETDYLLIPPIARDEIPLKHTKNNESNKKN